MKYKILKEIISYLDSSEKNIKYIKRVDTNTIKIEFSKDMIIYCNMTRGNSIIYSKENNSDSKRDFNAPFDVVLQKRFTNAKIDKIHLYNDDKIVNIDVLSKSSYKELKTTLQLEFTGKNTNIIILDEKRIVLEALRHIDEFSSTRYVKVGHTLKELEKIDFKKDDSKFDVDIKQYLYQTYKDLEEKELKAIKKQKISQVSKKIKKIQSVIDLLEDEEELINTSNDLYTKANLILSNIHIIKPYQEYIELVNFEGNIEKIQLNKNYPTPQRFANFLFNSAKKAKQKANKQYIERDNLTQKLTFLTRLEKGIELASTIDEIEFLIPKKEKNQKKTQKQDNYESYFYKGYKILLGRNERENIFLLENSRASDFWFHLKDRTSAHVIVSNTKKELPQEIIEKAAYLCAKFSLDFSGRVEVDYTQRRNVKIQSRANVLYNPYTTIVVTL